MRFESAAQFGPLVITQARTEMQHLIRHVVSLKVVVAAAQVYKSSRREHAFFIEDQANSPGPSLDGGLAVTAFGHSTRRSLGPIDSRKATLRQAVLCDPLQLVSIRDSRRGFTKSLQERLGTLIGGAYGVEP